MNITAKRNDELLAMMADTMAYPASSDYVYGGAPWIILSTQHAKIFKDHGIEKADVKRRLWEQSKMRAGRSKPGPRAELGEIGPDTLIPISARPEDITVFVAGGAGSHSVFVPVSAH